MTNRLTALAGELSSAVEVISKYLADNKLPQPSLQADGPVDLNLDTETQGAALKAIGAADHLIALLREPLELTLDHLLSPTHIYDTVLRFDIVKKVPLDGDISYADLASATGLEQSTLTRIIRHGTLWHLFVENRPGYVSHTLLTKMLATDELHYNFVCMIREEIIPGWMLLGDALEKYPGADEPSQSAYLMAMNSSEPGFFQELGKDPARARRFAMSMSQFSRDEQLGRDYDWSGIDGGKGTLVELGGSTGDVAFRISEQHPGLNIIVQDKEEVISQARERDGRNVSFQVHNFFDEEPVKGADAYMMRWCLHDWSDKYAARILKALIPALKVGTKVLIVDAVVPPFGVLPSIVERRLRDFDMGMLSIANAKERTFDDWKSLFAFADARFQLQKVVPLTKSQLSVIELEWKP